MADPEAHDYLAAVDYLELLYPHATAVKQAEALKKAKTIVKKAKTFSGPAACRCFRKTMCMCKRTSRNLRKRKSCLPYCW